MSPKAKEVPNILLDIFQDTVKPDVRDLKDKIQLALVANDFAQVNALTLQILETQANFNREIAESLRRVGEVLIKYNAGDIFIAPDKFSPFTQIEQQIDTAVGIVQESTEKKLVKNGHILSLIDTLQRNPDNTFLYTRKEILQRMIPLQHKDDPEAKIKASSCYSYTKSTIAKQTLEAAEAMSAHSIGEVYRDRIKTAKNTIWISYYEKAIELYGDMSPEEFIETVLNRFKLGRSSPEHSTIDSCEIVQKIKANPGTEMILAGKLSQETYIDQLAALLQINRDQLLTLAKRNGWKMTNPSYEIEFIAAFDKAKQIRSKNEPIQGKEEKESKKVIVNTIHCLFSGKYQHEVFKTNYTAWSFIASLVKEFQNKKITPDEVLTALFPVKAVRLDNQDFVLP